MSLYEMVPEFETTWIEYLYILADYKMSTEDTGTRCREIWENKSRYGEILAQRAFFKPILLRPNYQSCIEY
jgi:hypothetical protein